MRQSRLSKKGRYKKSFAWGMPYFSKDGVSNISFLKMAFKSYLFKDGVSLLCWKFRADSTQFLFHKFFCPAFSGKCITVDRWPNCRPNNSKQAPINIFWPGIFGGRKLADLAQSCGKEAEKSFIVICTTKHSCYAVFAGFFSIHHFDIISNFFNTFDLCLIFKIFHC
jgi:hypothetical protein